MTEPADHAASLRMAALIDASSLGTPAARRLRKRVSPETSSQVVAVAEASLAPVEVWLRMSSSGFSGIEPMIARAAAGDRAAIAEVLPILRVFVQRYCRARLGADLPTHSVTDVAQEAVLRVLQALPSYRDQGRPFIAFVYNIALHLVEDFERNRVWRRPPPPPDLVALHTPGDAAAAEFPLQELDGRLRFLLEALPNRQREIVILRVLIGLSASETADAVGSTPGAVRVAQHRALARLRRLYQAQSLRE
ncbi:sigma-70 family RNA polymerase sigma factor [Amycolatopsis sp. NPDC004625]|uniref:sigma-70 family RNA polymerase sigma factor n=1 Tax=Amycolatopsis sp. NPDC004625 TaxID=3154670 RepID=UPI0033BF8696